MASEHGSFHNTAKRSLGPSSSGCTNYGTHNGLLAFSFHPMLALDECIRRLLLHYSTKVGI